MAPGRSGWHPSSSLEGADEASSLASRWVPGAGSKPWRRPEILLLSDSGTERRASQATSGEQRGLMPAPAQRIPIQRPDPDRNFTGRSIRPLSSCTATERRKDVSWLASHESTEVSWRVLRVGERAARNKLTPAGGGRAGSASSGQKPPARAARAEPPPGEVRAVCAGHPLPPHHPKGTSGLHPSLLGVRLPSCCADVSSIEAQRRCQLLWGCARFAPAPPHSFRATRGCPRLEARPRLGDAATQWRRREPPCAGISTREQEEATERKALKSTHMQNAKLAEPGAQNSEPPRAANARSSHVPLAEQSEGLTCVSDFSFLLLLQLLHSLKGNVYSVVDASVRAIPEFRSPRQGKLFLLLVPCLPSCDTSGRPTFWVRKSRPGPSGAVSEADVPFGEPPSPSASVVGLRVLMRFFSCPVSRRGVRRAGDIARTARHRA